MMRRCPYRPLIRRLPAPIRCGDSTLRVVTAHATQCTFYTHVIRRHTSPCGTWARGHGSFPYSMGRCIGGRGAPENASGQDRRHSMGRRSPEPSLGCGSAPPGASPTQEAHPAVQLVRRRCTCRCGMPPNSGFPGRSVTPGADLSGAGTRERPARDVSTDRSGTLAPEPGPNAPSRVPRADPSVVTAHEGSRCVTVPDPSAPARRSGATPPRSAESYAGRANAAETRSRSPANEPSASDARRRRMSSSVQVTLWIDASR